MKAHISTAALVTTELEFNEKKYNVAASLSVLDKLERLDESIGEITSVKKIIKWLINDAVERENILHNSNEKPVTDEMVSLLIGKSNLLYYSDIMRNVLGTDFGNDNSEIDEDGNEVIVTDEMIEEFGETPKAKNVIAE